MILVALAIVAGFLAVVALALSHLTRKVNCMALDLAGLQVKLDALKVSVDAFIALPSNPAPVDLTPAGDAVDALKAEIDNKLTVPA